MAAGSLAFLGILIRFGWGSQRSSGDPFFQPQGVLVSGAVCPFATAGDQRAATCGLESAPALPASGLDLPSLPCFLISSCTSAAELLIPWPAYSEPEKLK